MSVLNKLNSFFFYFKPRKIVAQYKLFFGDEWLETSVDSIANHVYKILFVVSDIAWGDDPSNPKIKGDDLSSVITKLEAKYGDKLIVLNGSWTTQISHVQAGLDFIKVNIPQATHCLYIDSDEIYSHDLMVKLKNYTTKWKYFQTALRISYNNYFKTIFFKIDPNKYPNHLVLFPIRHWVKYCDARNVNCAIIEMPELKYEHPAYVRKNDEAMRLKIEAHRETEPILGDWYNEVWLKWDPDMTNFHPTHPEFWERVVKVDHAELPKEMIKVYESWKKP